MITLHSTDGTPSLLPTQANQIMGKVVWMQKGLHGLTLKLRVGEALDLKVRGNAQDKCTLPIRLGQWLEVEIPSDAIYLVAPELSPPKGRWTHWEGRIVLAPRFENNPCISYLTTVKVRGEQVTLNSQRTLGASSAPTQVGDRVVLLIDPRAVGIRSVEGAVEVASSSQGGFESDSLSPFQPQRVRLPGTILRTKHATVGVFVTLRIGQAVVSAHVTGERARADLWPAGRAATVIVGQHEAWIQSFGKPMTPCRLVDLARTDEVSGRPSLNSPASEKPIQI